MPQNCPKPWNGREVNVPSNCPDCLSQQEQDALAGVNPCERCVKSPTCIRIPEVRTSCPAWCMYAEKQRIATAQSGRG